MLPQISKIITVPLMFLAASFYFISNSRLIITDKVIAVSLWHTGGNRQGNVRDQAWRSPGSWGLRRCSGSGHSESWSGVWRNQVPKEHLVNTEI